MISKDYTEYKFVGIDPGTSTTGIAIVTTDDQLDIKKIETELIDVSNAKGVNLRHALDSRLHNIAVRLEEIILKEAPISVTVEKPFFYAKRPTAIVPLAQLLGVISVTVMQFMYTHYREYAPMFVKSTVGRGDSSKDDMLENLKRLNMSRFIDLDKISEHEVDAIAVVLTELELLKQDPYILFDYSSKFNNEKYRFKDIFKKEKK